MDCRFSNTKPVPITTPSQFNVCIDLQTYTRKKEEIINLPLIDKNTLELKEIITNLTPQ